MFTLQRSRMADGTDTRWGIPWTPHTCPNRCISSGGGRELGTPGPEPHYNLVVGCTSGRREVGRTNQQAASVVHSSFRRACLGGNSPPPSGIGRGVAPQHQV